MTAKMFGEGLCKGRRGENHAGIQTFLCCVFWSSSHYQRNKLQSKTQISLSIFHMALLDVPLCINGAEMFAITMYWVHWRAKIHRVPWPQSVIHHQRERQDHATSVSKGALSTRHSKLSPSFLPSGKCQVSQRVRAGQANSWLFSTPLGCSAVELSMAINEQGGNPPLA